MQIKSLAIPCHKKNILTVLLHVAMMMLNGARLIIVNAKVK